MTTPYQKQKLNKSLLKGLLTLTLLASTTIASHGQAALLVLIFGDKVASENFHLSIDGGLNVSTMPGLPQGKPLTGLHFGLGTFIKLNDRWALTPEFKPLSPRGATDVQSIYTDVSLQNPTTEINLNYIDIPLLVQYKLSDKISIAAGPQLSFLTSAKQKITGSLITGQNVVVTEDIKSLFHKESFMVPVQVAYALSSQRGGKGVNVKVRYNIGIMEVFTANSIASTTNSTFQFILSFPFINVPPEGQGK